MKKEIIPIVFSTDDNYVLPLSVAIQSIKSTLDGNYFLEIFVFQENLQESSINKLNLLKDEICNINFVDMSKYVNNLTFITHGRMTKASFYRIYATTILKDYEKIIYLDCDILANKSIHTLYCTDITSLLVAGVYDWGFIRQDIVVADDYFNAGVILFNVKNCNEFLFKEKCLEYLKQNPNLPWMDQDLLNAIAIGHVKLIGNEFDFMTFYCYDKEKHKDRLKEELKYQKVKSVKDIVIIHYTGDKPWNYKNVPLANLWWKQVAKLPKTLRKELKSKYKPKKYYGKVGYFFHKILVKFKMVVSKIVRRKNGK